MGFDELTILRTKNVSVTGYGFKLELPDLTKNSTVFKTYELIEWPHSHLSKSYGMDSQLSLCD